MFFTNLFSVCGERDADFVGGFLVLRIISSLLLIFGPIVLTTLFWPALQVSPFRILIFFALVTSFLAQHCGLFNMSEARIDYSGQHCGKSFISSKLPSCGGFFAVFCCSMRNSKTLLRLVVVVRINMTVPLWRFVDANYFVSCQRSFA